MAVQQFKGEPDISSFGVDVGIQSVLKKPANMEGIQESIFLPVTRADLEVLRSLFNCIMPYLLGWNAFGNSIKPEVYSQVNSTNPRYGADNEWNR
ncbi:hypothetical protein JHK85_003115 [Glycine max]|nr:hypothetical protein JHK85_003115 [Glycine max]